MLATSSLDHTVNHAHVRHTCQSASPVTSRADGYSHRKKSDVMVPITSSSICSKDPRSLLLVDLLQLGPFDLAVEHNKCNAK